jgi:hypothetical protein
MQRYCQKMALCRKVFAVPPWREEKEHLAWKKKKMSEK